MTKDLRARILESADILEETVTVPEWDVTVIVRALDLGQRNDVIVEARNPETGRMDLSVYYSRIVQLCTVDPESGELVFAPDDVGLLQRKSPKAADRIAKRALDLAGLGEEDDEKAVQNAGKGSSKTKGGASTS